MLNTKKDKSPGLIDSGMSRIDAVELKKLEEGEKPSIVSDTMFKAMFFNKSRIKYSVKLISYYLDISYEKLLKNIKLTKNELDTEKLEDKSYRSDYVAIIDDTLINIEMNNNADKSGLERNLDYSFRLFSSSAKKSKDKKSYKYQQVIQFNINNFAFKNHEETVDTYTLRTEDNIKLTNKIIIIEIYIPNLRKKWYSKGIEELTESERYALALIEPSISDSIKLGEGIEIMDDYINEAEDTIEDEYFGESYDKELAYGEAMRDEGIKQGIKQGLQQGIAQEKTKREEMVKSLYEQKVSLEIIETSSGLSKKEILNIVNQK